MRRMRVGILNSPDHPELRLRSFEKNRNGVWDKRDPQEPMMYLRIRENDIWDTLKSSF